jgi:hypothetical protein
MGALGAGQYSQQAHRFFACPRLAIVATLTQSGHGEIHHVRSQVLLQSAALLSQAGKVEMALLAPAKHLRKCATLRA